jgi:hypothetical protein
MFNDREVLLIQRGVFDHIQLTAKTVEPDNKYLLELRSLYKKVSDRVTNIVKSQLGLTKTNQDKLAEIADLIRKLGYDTVQITCLKGETIDRICVIRLS